MTALDLQSSTPSPFGAPGRVAIASRLDSGTVVCEACGCRLTVREARGTGAGPTWIHFTNGHAGRDARGCTVACVEMLHRLA